MITIKQNWFKRSLSLLSAFVMCASMVSVPAFAEGAEPKTPIEKIDVPVEDGVYYADIDLLQASNPNQYSMGNAALRGSTSFKQKQPDDTYSKSIVVVKDNKATAIVEFMPMGYIGRYGFMMELESVDARHLTQWGGVYDGDAAFTPANVLAKHMSSDGKTVYDAYNDPESVDCFNGNKTRPAGFGYDYERTVDISDQSYSHILALDVTPIHICFANNDPGIPADISEYTRDNAAYVHVFVPVMFSISPTSGDQYARLMVDWSTLEKIEEPEKNLQYALWSAKQIEQNDYTNASYTALQNTIDEITVKLENIWPNQTISMSGAGFNAQPKLEQKEYSDSEKIEMAEKLNTAVSALELKGEKETLDTVIARAEEISEELYTPESYAEMKDALDAAVNVQDNEDAGVSEINSAVQTLNDKIEALVYRDADYSAVDAALEKIPADLSAYTDESAAGVNAAREAIVRGKNITEQNAVDAMAKRIEEAVGSLELKASPDKPNKSALEDGVYSIYGEMIKVNRQDKSMSNEAINHTIKLTVENGKYYLTLDFQGLHYLNRFGYLAKLAYYDNGYTYGQYGKIEGTLIPAEVLSTQKNSDGSDIIDEFNSNGGSSAGLLYPDQMKFPLVSDALNDPDGYVPLHVFVPVMEDISAGTGDQDVLLKLDWSTLAKTTEDDPGFRPEDPSELSPAVNYTDTATGVQIHADKGVFDEGVKFVVNEITVGADYDNSASALSDVGKKFKLYDVKFLDKDGNETSPNGTVTISFPIGAGYDTDKLAVYRINDDDSKTLVKGAAENGMYIITTKTAAKYALAEKDSNAVNEQNGQNSNDSQTSAGGNTADNGSDASPQTSDNGNTASWLLMALSSIGLLAAMTFTRKHRSEKGE